MIQRIQSVYLLLAGVCLLVTYFVPLAAYSHEGLAVGTLFLKGLNNINGHTLSPQWLLMTVCAVSILVCWGAIFGYKNRLRQMAIVNAAMLLILLLFIAGIVTAWQYLSDLSGCTVAPAYGTLFPLLAYVFAFLARRGIRKDEELVRSAERFR